MSEAANKESWFVQIEEQIATLMFGKKATFEKVAEQLEETERLVTRIYTNTECKLAEEVLALLKQRI